jgi:hypothetical protein
VREFRVSPMEGGMERVCDRLCEWNWGGEDGGGGDEAVFKVDTVGIKRRECTVDSLTSICLHLRVGD